MTKITKLKKKKQHACRIFGVSILFGSRVQSHINDLSFAGSVATLDQFINEEPCQASEPNLAASVPGQLLGDDGGVLDFDSDGSNVGHNATDQAVTPVSSRSCFYMVCLRVGLWVNPK